MYNSDNNNFAALQHGQENHPAFAFSLWYLAPRSLALEVFKLPILLPVLLLLELLQKAIQSLLKMHSPKMPYLYLKNRTSVWN